MADQVTTYDEYEAALDALSGVPEALRRSLATAAEDRTTALRTAERTASEEVARLDALRRTTQGRYEAAVEKLSAHGVTAPAKVRPVPGSGDEPSLREAVAAHTAAVAGIDSALHSSAAEAQRANAENASRAVAAQQASVALRSRQEKLQRQREAAAEEARRATATAARRRRLTVLYGAGALLLAAAITIIIVIAISH